MKDLLSHLSEFETQKLLDWARKLLASEAPREQGAVILYLRPKDAVAKNQELF